MSRMTSLVLAGAVTLAATVHPTLAQNAPTVEVEPLRGALHLLQGRGGNVVASVGLDGVLLIDDDYPDLGEAYEEKITELAGGLAPQFVINTHWHGDHTGNNQFWGERGAVIVAHRNVRQRMSSKQIIEALAMEVQPSPAIALPLVTYGDGLTLHFNGSDVEVQHYPAGHTDGDSVVYYSAENVVHMGDLFFRDAFPFIDLSSGGSIKGYIANVEAVLGRVDDKTLIVPGHGSLASKSDLQRYLAMLRETTATIGAELDKGRSVEDITAAGLGAQWESWGKGFIKQEQWIATIAADR